MSFIVRTTKEYNAKSSNPYWLAIGPMGDLWGKREDVPPYHFSNPTDAQDAINERDDASDWEVCEVTWVLKDPNAPVYDGLELRYFIKEEDYFHWGPKQHQARRFASAAEAKAYRTNWNIALSYGERPWIKVVRLTKRVSK